MRIVLAVAAVAVIAACQPWDAPYEKSSRTVEGCDDAVAHLRSCCPRYDSYLSCTYLANSTAPSDLTTSESRCLVTKSCSDLQHAVQSADRICGFLPATKSCR
jgi:hypothetical protein